MRENIIKTYWQAVDGNGKVFSYNIKPVIGKDKDEYRLSEGGSLSNIILFPIPLNPLQIAEIKVNENGTWSYEIEREEGWYMAKWSDKIDTAPDRKNIFIEYKCGKYLFPGGKEISLSDFAELTISTTRIPDECII
jgi:hypothetical protein